MIAGLPLGTWVLMVLSTLPGLVLVVAAYRVHAAADRRQGATGSGGESAAGGSGARGRGQENGGERGPEAPQARPDRSRSRG
ncbi:MAG: hypothetical protein OXU74_10815 [Gemmatimonadota bacterium]|nr:hypothetical protein [Gemmatimonadota bacterium]